MPKGQPTRYRAGIDFGLTADADGVNGFAKKNKKGHRSTLVSGQPLGHDAARVE